MVKCLICGGPHNMAEHYAQQKNVTPEPKEDKTVTKSVTKTVTKNDKDRVYAWRENNRDRYNEKQRELMRKRAKA